MILYYYLKTKIEQRIDELIPKHITTEDMIASINYMEAKEGYILDSADYIEQTEFKVL